MHIVWKLKLGFQYYLFKVPISLNKNKFEWTWKLWWIMLCHKIIKINVLYFIFLQFAQICTMHGVTLWFRLQSALSHFCIWSDFTFCQTLHLVTLWIWSYFASSYSAFGHIVNLVKFCICSNSAFCLTSFGHILHLEKPCMCTCVNKLDLYIKG